jgi:ankyrin repeat protein
LQEGHASIVERLMQRAELDLNSTEENGITPINMAAQQGHLNVVRLLMADTRVDVNR